MLSGREWPKASKSVQLTGEPLRFACRSLEQEGLGAGRNWAGGWEAPRRGTCWEVRGGFSRAGGSCPPESQEERDVHTSAWRASPWLSATKGPVIALPTLCLSHSILGLRGSHERGTWQGSRQRGMALHSRPPVACGCGDHGVSEVASGAAPS